jgi:dihydroneopterin aldolase
MLTVHLQDLIFFGYHGLYEGEEKVGNNFQLSLDVSYHVKHDKLNDLKNLISYEDLFYLVRKRMNLPTALLEELANGIVSLIKHQYAQVESVKLSIYKLNPPIENFQGKVGITLFRKFDV